MRETEGLEVEMSDLSPKKGRTMTNSTTLSKIKRLVLGKVRSNIDSLSFTQELVTSLGIVRKFFELDVCSWWELTEITELLVDTLDSSFSNGD
jgi:predicted NUDIX family NTP pyrophosphohydrolase